VPHCIATSVRSKSTVHAKAKGQCDTHLRNIPNAPIHFLTPECLGSVPKIYLPIPNWNSYSKKALLQKTTQFSLKMAILTKIPRFRGEFRSGVSED
jgi:hypothetical protein